MEVRYRNPVKQLGFAQIEHIATLDPELSDGAYRTFALYIMYAQQKGLAWPSRDTMSKQRSKEQTTISRHNEELERLGYIARQRRRGQSSITWIEDTEHNPRLLDLAGEVIKARNVAKMQRRTLQKCNVEEEQYKNQLPPTGGKEASDGTDRDKIESVGEGSRAASTEPNTDSGNTERDGRRVVGVNEGNSGSIPARIETTNKTREADQVKPADTVKGSRGSEPTGNQLEIGVYDLDVIAWEMEGTGHKRKDLTALCILCGRAMTQADNVCQDCGAHVVWQNSPIWKKLYGKPDEYIRRINGEDLKATTPLEIVACRAFGKGNKFANVTQQRTFRRLERKYPAGYLEKLAEWSKGKGFTAFVSAANNPSNLADWNQKNHEERPHSHRFKEVGSEPVF